MEKLLRGLLVAFGATVTCIPLALILAGSGILPGFSEVNATMDSEFRFQSAFFLAYGLCLLWCSQDPVGRSSQIRLLMLVFFMGGLARLASMVAVGPPHAFFVAMMVVEIVIAPVVAWLAMTVSRQERG